MDTSSIAIGVILLLLFVGPVLYIIIRQNSTDTTRLKNLRSLSEQNQMELDEYEVTNGVWLGLDLKSKKLMVVDPKKNMHNSIIDLKKVSESQVSKKGSPKVKGGENDLSFTHISLKLINSNPQEVISEIVFYDEEDTSNYDADAQLAIANKWDLLIRNNISALKL